MIGWPAGHVPRLPVGLAATLRLLWQIPLELARDFVWADLRDGLVDLRGFSSATRALAWLGFALLLAVVGLLLFHDLWRRQFPLLALPAGAVGRGRLLPYPLAPATLFLFSVAWAFALAGALRAHPLARLCALLVYLFSAVGWLAGIQFPSLLPALAAWGGLAAVVALFWLCRRARPRPAWEFLALLLLVSTTFALAQAGRLENWRVTGVPLALSDLGYSVTTLSSVALPLLLLLGLDVAGFARQLADWGASIARERLPALALPLLLAGLLGWRVYTVGAELAARIGASSPLVQAVLYAWALLVPLGVGLVWWLVWRRAPSATLAQLSESDVVAEAMRGAFPLVLAHVALELLTLALLDVVFAAQALLLWLGHTDAQESLRSSAAVAIAWLNAAPIVLAWRVVVDAAALALALRFAQRGRPALALYLGVFAVLDARGIVAYPDGPLGSFFFTNLLPGSPVDFWWVVVFTGLLLFWLARGTLDRDRVGRLLYVVALSALLRQTDFIASPFSPLLGFAGIGFLAFALVWDALTIGVWANRDSPGLPRLSRVFLYLGYVLLSVTIVNWTLATRDLARLDDFTGNVTLVGLERYGRPLLYAVIALTLALPRRKQPAPALALGSRAEGAGQGA